MDADDRLAALTDALTGAPGVAPPGASGKRGFGSAALTVDGSIFAMVTRGSLVLKLPRERVDALVAEGGGAPFDAGRGRTMREWVVLGDDAGADLPLAREALEFVRTRGR